MPFPIRGALDIILNPDNIPSTFTHEVTVIGDFTATNGKFGDILGNVALVDCNYVNRLIYNTYDDYIKNLLDENPLYFIASQQVDVSIRDAI